MTVLSPVYFIMTFVWRMYRGRLDHVCQQHVNWHLSLFFIRYCFLRLYVESPHLDLASQPDRATRWRVPSYQGWNIPWCYVIVIKCCLWCMFFSVVKYGLARTFFCQNINNSVFVPSVFPERSVRTLFGVIRFTRILPVLCCYGSSMHVYRRWLLYRFQISDARTELTRINTSWYTCTRAMPNVYML